MNKFRSRLLFALTMLIIAVLVALGLILGQLFNSFYLQTFEERFEKEVEFVEALLSRNPTTFEKEEILKKANETLNSHIILYDAKGEVQFHTDASYIDRNDEMIAEIIIANHRNKKDGFRIWEKDKGFFFYGKPILKNSEVDGYIVLGAPVQSINSVTKEVWFLLIASLGLALLVIMILGVRITREYTRPIESATKVAIELAKGNYKARTFEDHLDETGMLSQAINILARNLQDMTRAQEMQQDRLKTLIENMGSGLILIDGRGYINLVNKAYKELFHVQPEEFLYKLYYNAFHHKEVIDIVKEVFMTESKIRKHLMIPLDLELRHFEVYGAPIIGHNDEWKGIVLVFHDITELKKLEQMRKDFVANVSHELKTPITSIKGFSETLLDGAMNHRDTLESFLSIILKESERLQTLIQDLLDLSKIEQQGFKLNIQDCDMKELLTEIYTLLESNANERNIDLSLVLPSEKVWVKGDPYRLKQVFINLINNALTYTKADGKVTIELEHSDGEVVVRVIDTGVGIQKDELPRIFERFYRIDKARTRNSGGTGLGLAIVKHLVEAHKAEIKVESEVGKGTKFTLIFPKNYIEE
ncbi:ATP-binding protein [Bacillus sp. FJAT-47783]|uniref:two-component system histidine kinase PnpS n=1 Tax=Bacillus sp. FJAT-47783 TaxID=2922712 RepID=UPI001FAE6A25|nr:ATP-binding protein [Bacillus sp. FJAT-47783]